MAKKQHKKEAKRQKIEAQASKPGADTISLAELAETTTFTDGGAPFLSNVRLEDMELTNIYHRKLWALQVFDSSRATPSPSMCLLRSAGLAKPCSKS
jgi:hypothetical protein